MVLIQEWFTHMKDGEYVINPDEYKSTRTH